MSTTLDLTKLRDEAPEAMAQWDAERRVIFHCPDWCEGDPQLHDVGIYTDGTARVSHDGPMFGEAFVAGGDTHPETGAITGLDIRTSLVEGAEFTAEELRRVAAAALAAAEWLEARA